MTTCQTCAHWTSKGSKDMATHGFGLCALGTRWTYYPPQHTCPGHKPAAEDVQAARAKWLSRKSAA